MGGGGLAFLGLFHWAQKGAVMSRPDDGRPSIVTIAFVAVMAGVATAGAAQLLSREDADRVATPAATGEPSSSDTSTSTMAPPSSAPPSCDPIAPRRLPSGDGPGEGSRFKVDSQWSWGEGPDRVVQRAGDDALSLLEAPFAEVVRGQRFDSRLILVGDEGVGEVAFAFRSDGCEYTVWLAPGTLLPVAREFAEQY